MLNLNASGYCARYPLGASVIKVIHHSFIQLRLVKLWEPFNAVESYNHEIKSLLEGGGAYILIPIKTYTYFEFLKAEGVISKYLLFTPCVNFT